MILTTDDTRIFEMRLLPRDGQQAAISAGDLSPEEAAAHGLDAGRVQNRYEVVAGASPALAYELEGIMDTLEDIGDEADVITLDWKDAQTFLITVIRKVSDQAMADFAGGDSVKLLTTEPRALSDGIAEDPLVWALRTFYAAAFGDGGDTFGENTFAVALR